MAEIRREIKKRKEKYLVDIESRSLKDPDGVGNGFVNIVACGIMY